MIKEHDVVIAKRDLSKTISKGTKGVIVMIYREPKLGYEVEFVGASGDTISVITVYPDDIETVS